MSDFFCFIVVEKYSPSSTMALQCLWRWQNYSIKCGVDMKSAIAGELFHGRESFNCTQAVLKAFQDESGVHDDIIRAASAQGGGRAPGNMCGALYAAAIMLGDGPLFDELSRSFELTAGSVKCRQIRSMKKISCRECVTLSAGLLEPHAEFLSSLKCSAV